MHITTSVIQFFFSSAHMCCNGKISIWLCMAYKTSTHSFPLLLSTFREHLSKYAYGLFSFSCYFGFLMLTFALNCKRSAYKISTEQIIVIIMKIVEKWRNARVEWTIKSGKKTGNNSICVIFLLLSVCIHLSNWVISKNIFISHNVCMQLHICMNIKIEKHICKALTIPSIMSLLNSWSFQRMITTKKKVFDIVTEQTTVNTDYIGIHWTVVWSNFYHL